MKLYSGKEDSESKITYVCINYNCINWYKYRSTCTIILHTIYVEISHLHWIQPTVLQTLQIFLYKLSFVYRHAVNTDY